MTYAAIQGRDLDWLLTQCNKSAAKLGMRFEVMTTATGSAHTWVGAFDNGWMFALADPAVWELGEIFKKVARDNDLPCLLGSTDGDFTKWNYTFVEHGEVRHRFFADPFGRFEPHEHAALRGDPAHLAEVFGVSRFKVQPMLRPLGGVSVHDFHSLLGFEPSRASGMKFVVVGPAASSGPATFSMDLKSADQPTTSVGLTTKAFNSIDIAKLQGLGHAAAMQAERFVKAASSGEAVDLFRRLQQAGKHDEALVVMTNLIQRVQAESSSLPEDQARLRMAMLWGLKGMAHYELKQFDEAVVAFRDHALTVNPYVGPEHRAAFAARLGKLLCRNSPREALRPLRLALAERPVDASVWAALAQAAKRCDLHEEARTAVLMGMAADARLGAWPTIMREVGVSNDELLPARDPNRVKPFRHDARNLVRMGKRPQALAHFRLALHHDPSDVDSAWSVAAAIAEGVRNGEMPDDPEDHEVTRLLEQVCFARPTWPWGWGTLIEVLGRRGEHERATQAADAYARVHVERLEDLLDVGCWLATASPPGGIALLRILLERFVELRMKGFTSADQREVARFRALSALGTALLESGHVKEALDPLLEAHKIDPNHIENLAGLARTHLALKNWRAANKAASRGLQTHPDHEQLRRVLNISRQYLTGGMPSL